MPQPRPQASDDQLKDLINEQLSAVDTTPLVQGETLSPDEVAEIERQYSLSQPIKIPNDKLDPNYVYRWIGKDIGNFRKRIAKGWQVVTRAKLVELCRSGITIDDLHMGTHTNPDDLVSLNQDMVLGYLPKRVALAFEQHHLRRSQAREGSASKTFHQTGQLVGEAGYDVGTFDKR